MLCHPMEFKDAWLRGMPWGHRSTPKALNRKPLNLLGLKAQAFSFDLLMLALTDSPRQSNEAKVRPAA